MDVGTGAFIALGVVLAILYLAWELGLAMARAHEDKLRRLRDESRAARLEAIRERRPCAIRGHAYQRGPGYFMCGRCGDTVKRPS